MKFCLVKIHKSPVSGDYVQNNFDLVEFDSRKDAEANIRKFRAVSLKDLTKEDRPINDIRGNIINERGEIFGFLDANDNAQYFSLVEMEEERRNEFLKG